MAGRLYQDALFALIVLGGCLRSASVDCPNGGVCPAGLRCGMARGILVCIPPACGNGRYDPGEACDDGNNVSGDGCPADCTSPCGDGILDPGEACDDGNTVSGDGCSNDCRSKEVCGNGILDPGEACDDGNTVSGDGCSNDCRSKEVCGNGILDPGEACDDGNTSDGDDCSSDCRTEVMDVCGNGIVTRGEDCDDGNLVDGDGCDASCHFAACPGEVPVGPGAGGSLPVAGQIAKMIADPASCFLYALDTASPSHLIVISTASRRPLTRITLLEDAIDIAISPSGTYLVISYVTNAIGIVDTATWRQTVRVPTFAGPFSVAVTDRGIAFYGEFASTFHRIDLRDGSGDGPGLTLLSGPQLSLSRDGHSLYVGEWGTTGGLLVKYDVTGGTAVLVDNSTIGFDLPSRHAYVSPGGQHVYYADHQFDTASLAAIRGSTGELIYAENVAGTFAVGANHVFDADLVRPVATLPHTASAAVLAAGDRELWYYSPDTGQIYYVDPQDLIGGVSFGVREVDPAPLGAFHFAKLIHDPVRSRLYGVDTAQAAVVVIDDTTLQPMRAILVGSTPGDIDIDATGTTLFVAHDDVTAFARIRLDTPSFDGFVRTERFASRLASVGGGRLVILDRAQFNTPMLADAITGAVVSRAGLVAGGVVAATADGGTVFIGESDVFPGTMIRYSLATGRLVETNSSTALLEGIEIPVVAVPDGSGVFYTGHFLNGHDLSLALFTFDGPILAVSLDGRRALSAGSVYDVATGTRLGALPATASAVAISPDGTKAFLSSDGALRSVDLTAF